MFCLVTGVGFSFMLKNNMASFFLAVGQAGNLCMTVSQVF